VKQLQILEIVSNEMCSVCSAVGTTYKSRIQELYNKYAAEDNSLKSLGSSGVMGLAGK
jgi:hypothetical protein